MGELTGRRVGVLAEDHYEDLELWYPVLRLREAGAKVSIVGMPGNEVYHSKHDYPVEVEVTAGAVSSQDFDALIVPGGYAPDRIRRYQEMLDLVKGVFDNGGVVAFICHAGWVPISAGIVEGKRVTSVSSIKDDLINAGAIWEDQEVVRDGSLISSRGIPDLPAFCRAIIATLQWSAPSTSERREEQAVEESTMRCKVDREECIGDGSCEDIAPDYFQLDDEDLARAIKNPVAEEDEDLVREAAEACPVEAISLEDEEGNRIYP